MNLIQDLDLLTIARWAVVFQEVRIKWRGKIWGEEDMAVGGSAGADRSGGEATESATVVAGEGGGNRAAVAIGGSSNEVVADEVADVGGNEAVSGSSGGFMGSGGRGAGSEGGAMGSSGGAAGTPPTPTVKELLATAERASDERRADVSSEAAVGGRVVSTPVLRTTVVEPRWGDSGIRASRSTPFEAGDFLDSAGPQDILGTLSLIPGIADILRAAETPEDRTSALLLGALLSGTGASDIGGHGVESETAEVETEEREPEAAAKQRVTAVEEVKAYLGGERPQFTLATYAPRLHFFEPVGIISYVPTRADYPEDTLLRDRDSYISSGWTTVSFDNLNLLNFVNDHLLPIAFVDIEAISLLC
ncbi:hypothetical protein RHMOL_Rhmol02G0195300 [Rhododendron molle]|uniref:Uncharacterized protein n=1 Tax=Rhododendron molle TaxID=49168 RepID=A0ACC0PUQ4_RHOML|nr:hypothetical protein RHMOL_Rhmol02G0195300 [Rhododendron molle]